MTSDKDEKEGAHFFDVERYKQIHAASQRPKTRIERITSSLGWAISSHQGLLTAILFPLAMIPGMLVGIVLLVWYGGGLAFYGAVAAFFVGAAIVGEKRVTSGQFVDSSFLKKTLAQIVAYSAIVGVFLLMLYEWKGF
ncbi:MAG TPA: hypothetical protein VE955_05570 [Candidatus Dormibacteraeota bacterium]|nr:hypothetical protein [Candidatus Dormibacteraeota bacterium]